VTGEQREFNIEPVAADIAAAPGDRPTHPILHRVEVLRVAKAGNYFGEIGPVFGLPRSATVRARTDVAVTGYSVPAFRQRLGAAAGPGLNEGRELALE
jgi:hypothetical protein